jgi:hypothetical protein
VPIPVVELRSPRRAVTAVCQRPDTRRCDQKLSWPTARTAVTSARSVPERHPDVAQVAARCCERNQLLLGSATTAGGLFNGAIILHFLRSGCGCKACTAQREVFTARYELYLDVQFVSFCFSFKGPVIPVSSYKVISDIFGPALRHFHSSVFSGPLPLRQFMHHA